MTLLTLDVCCSHPQPGAQRKFLTEAEELAYIAKKKRLAQMVRDGSPAADPEQVVNTRGKKQKSAALQYELAGKAQKVALFVPQRLRNVKWEEYTVDGLRATSERKIIEKEVEKEPFKQRTYEETLDLLLGDKGKHHVGHGVAAICVHCVCVAVCAWTQPRPGARRRFAARTCAPQQQLLSATLSLMLLRPVRTLGERTLTRGKSSMMTEMQTTRRSFTTATPFYHGRPLFPRVCASTSRSAAAASSLTPNRSNTGSWMDCGTKLGSIFPNAATWRVKAHVTTGGGAVHRANVQTLPRESGMKTRRTCAHRP